MAHTTQPTTKTWRSLNPFCLWIGLMIKSLRLCLMTRVLKWDSCDCMDPYWLEWQICGRESAGGDLREKKSFVSISKGRGSFKRGISLQGQQLLDLEHKLTMAKEELEKTALDKVNRYWVSFSSSCNHGSFVNSSTLFFFAEQSHPPQDAEAASEVPEKLIKWFILDVDSVQETSFLFFWDKKKAIFLIYTIHHLLLFLLFFSIIVLLLFTFF